MKRIDTLIHPARWEEARALFETLAVPVMLREVKTYGRTPPRREVYRGTAYYASFASELELTAVVAEEQLEHALSVLEPLAHGGEILVSTVEVQAARRSDTYPVATRQPAEPNPVWPCASPVAAY
ncbi:MAG: P-II family nitrogen regulator [Polyangiaceae bacterium]